MLQYIARPSELYSVAEQAQMAVEAGVKWVIFDPEGMDDADVRDTLAELVALCRENETILTITGHTEAAREQHIHGVQLSSASEALAAREQLGPEAIVGVTVGGADGIAALRGKDMDYFVLPAKNSLAEMARTVEAVRASGDTTAIVAGGDYSLDELEGVMATGVSGVQLHRAIALAPDPVEAARRALEILHKNH